MRTNKGGKGLRLPQGRLPADERVRYQQLMEMTEDNVDFIFNEHELQVARSQCYHGKSTKHIKALAILIAERELSPEQKIMCGITTPEGV